MKREGNEEREECREGNKKRERNECTRERRMKLSSFFTLILLSHLVSDEREEYRGRRMQKEKNEEREE